MTREQYEAQRHVAQFSFAMDDALLFLDAYPCCSEAREYYFSMKDEYESAKADYENKFGPLTADSPVGRGEWQWTETPWPWQICEGGRR